jgi:Aminoglycoside adenylyltransferase, C-terminal domain/Nucleotidyltransferase domain
MGLNIPYETEALLLAFARSFQDVFGETLIGVYLHGSLAMGCFNPATSDVDVLIVVRDELSVDAKGRAGRALLWLAEQAPAKGLEVSILSLDDLHPFQYPTPYQLHFSNDNNAQFAQGTMDLEGARLDGDLAAHIVVTRARGVCLYGEPIAVVFPEVPREAYLNSITVDSEDSYYQISRGVDAGECAVPVYGVLNFCRVLAFVEDGAITSKLEGGQWGLDHLPPEYRPIIKAALLAYTGADDSGAVDAKLLKQFARFAQARIDQATGRHTVNVDTQDSA